MIYSSCEDRLHNRRLPLLTNSNKILKISNMRIMMITKSTMFLTMRLEKEA